MDDNWNNWAETVIRIWQEKIDRMHVYQTGALRDSFINHVINHANGSLPRIEFFFINYGRFADMGVGRNYKLGNSGSVDAVRKTRSRKRWYSTTAYAEYKKVSEYIQKRFGEQAGMAFIESMKKVLATDLK